MADILYNSEMKLKQIESSDSLLIIRFKSVYTGTGAKLHILETKCRIGFTRFRFSLYFI